MSKLILFVLFLRLNRIIEEKVPGENEVLFVIDNNKEAWDREICGLKVFPPEEMYNAQYDYIVITPADTEPIYDQLINMKVPADKLLTYKQLSALDRHGEIRIYGQGYGLKEDRTNLLFVAVKLAYNGGAIAVISQFLMPVRISLRK